MSLMRHESPLGRIPGSGLCALNSVADFINGSGAGQPAHQLIRGGAWLEFSWSEHSVMGFLDRMLHKNVLCPRHEIQ